MGKEEEESKESLKESQERAELFGRSSGKKERLKWEGETMEEISKTLDELKKMEGGDEKDDAAAVQKEEGKKNEENREGQKKEDVATSQKMELLFGNEHPKDETIATKSNDEKLTKENNEEKQEKEEEEEKIDDEELLAEIEALNTNEAQADHKEASEVDNEDSDDKVCSKNDGDKEDTEEKKLKEKEAMAKLFG